MKGKLNSRQVRSSLSWHTHALVTFALVVLTMCSGKKEGDTPDRDHVVNQNSRGMVTAVKTIHPQYVSLSYPLEVTGVVTYDPRRIHAISARVSGRIEKMYAKYPLQRINRGQRIADVYSPELSAAVRELRLVAANEQLMTAARERLHLLGLRDSEINDAALGRINSTFPLYSPYAGYVLPHETAPYESAVPMGERIDAVRSNGNAAASLPREGDYVSSGQTLLRIVNVDAVRAEFDLHHFNASAVTIGDTITVHLRNDAAQKAIVDFVEPFVEQGKTFSRIRVAIENPARLRIGQLVRGTITARSEETLWLPREAVMDLGSHEVVFAKVHDAFVPVGVTSGIRTRNLIEIKSGLATGDEVAANAHFLMDRDSFIKPINTQ